jgi:hypothetical protein
LICGVVGVQLASLTINQAGGMESIEVVDDGGDEDVIQDSEDQVTAIDIDKESVVDVGIINDAVAGAIDSDGVGQIPAIDSLFKAILESSKRRAASYTDPDDEFIQAEGYDRAFQLPTGQRDCVELRQVARFNLEEAVYIMRLANEEVSKGTKRFIQLRAKLAEVGKTLAQSKPATTPKADRVDIATDISTAFSEFDILDYQITWGGYDTSNAAFRTVKRIMKNLDNDDDEEINRHQWREAKLLSKKLQGDLDTLYKAERDEARREIDYLIKDFHHVFGQSVDDSINGRDDDSESAGSEESDMQDFDDDEDMMTGIEHGEDGIIAGPVRYRDAEAEAGSTRTRTTRKIIDKYDEHGRLILPQNRKRSSRETAKSSSSSRAEDKDNKLKRKRSTEIQQRRQLRTSREDDSATSGTAKKRRADEKEHRFQLRWSYDLPSDGMEEDLTGEDRDTAGRDHRRQNRDQEEQSDDDEWYHIGDTSGSPAGTRDATTPRKWRDSPLQMVVKLTDRLGQNSMVSVIPFTILSNNSTNESNRFSNASISSAPPVSLMSNIPVQLVSASAHSEYSISRDAPVEMIIAQLKDRFLDVQLSLQSVRLAEITKSVTPLLEQVCLDSVRIVEFDGHTGRCMIVRDDSGQQHQIDLGAGEILGQLGIEFFQETKRFHIGGTYTSVENVAPLLCGYHVDRVVTVCDQLLLPLISVSNRVSAAMGASAVSACISSNDVVTVCTTLIHCLQLEQTLLRICAAAPSSSSSSSCCLHDAMESLMNAFLMRDFGTADSMVLSVLLYLEVRYHKLLLLGQLAERCVSYRKVLSSNKRRAQANDISSEASLIDMQIRFVEMMEVCARLGVECVWDELVSTAMMVDWLLVPMVVSLLGEVQSVDAGTSSDDIGKNTLSSSDSERLLGMPSRLWTTTFLYTHKSTPQFSANTHRHQNGKARMSIFFGPGKECPFVKMAEVFTQLWVATTIVSAKIGNMNSPTKLVHNQELASLMPVYFVDLCARPWELMNKRIANVLSHVTFPEKDAHKLTPSTKAKSMIGLCRCIEQSSLERVMNLLASRDSSSHNAVNNNSNTNSVNFSSFGKNVVCASRVVVIRKQSTNDATTNTMSNDKSRRNKDSANNVIKDSGMFYRILAIQALHSYALSVTANLTNSSSSNNNNNDCLLAPPSSVCVLPLPSHCRTNNWKFIEQLVLSNIAQHVQSLQYHTHKQQQQQTHTTSSKQVSNHSDKQADKQLANAAISAARDSVHTSMQCLYLLSHHLSLCWDYADMGITAFVSIASVLLQLTHLVCVCTVTMRRDSLLQLDGDNDDGNDGNDGNDEWDRQTSLDQWMSKVVAVNTNHNNKSKQTPDATNAHNNNTQHRRENLASTRFLEEFVIQQCHHVSGDIDVEGGAQDGTNKHMFALPMAMLASTLSSQLTEETDKQAFLQFAKYVCSDHHATTNDVDIAHIVLPTHTNTHTNTTHTTSTHPSKHTNTSISVVLRVISHCFGRLLAGCVQRDPTLGNTQSSSHMRITSVLFAHIERVLAPTSTQPAGDQHHCPFVIRGLLMCVLASHGCRQFGFHRVDPAIVNENTINTHTINTQVLAAAFQRNCFEQNKLLKCVLESIHTRNHQAMPQAIPNSTAHTTPTHVLAESLLVWLICGCTMTGTLTHTFTHTLTLTHTQSSITMLSCLVSCISSENIRNRSKLSEWKAAHTHPYAHTTHTGAVCVPTVIRSLLLTTLSYCVTVLNHLRARIAQYFMGTHTKMQCTDDEMMVTLDVFRTVWFECLSTIFMCLDKMFVRQAPQQQQTAKKQTTRSSSSKQSLMAAAGLETLTWMTHTCLRTLIHAVSTPTTTNKPNMCADKLKALSADIMMHLLQTQQQPQHQQQAQMFHVCVFPALRETLTYVCAQTLKDWHTHTHISSAFPTNTHTNTRQPQPQATSLDAHVLRTVDRFQAAVDDEDEFFDDDEDDGEGAMSAHSHQHNHDEVMHLIVCVLANINTAANMFVTEFLGASTQTPHNRPAPNMGPLASMHVQAFKESMATLDCVHKEMNGYANTHTNSQSSSSQQQTDNPLQTWLQCKFLASLLSSVSAGVWTVCVKDVLVPNMYRVQCVWLACVIALTIPHTTHSPQSSHTRSNGTVSTNNASIVASIEFGAFHVGLLRVCEAVCANPSQFTSTMNTPASTLAALASVFARSQAAHTTGVQLASSQSSSLQSQLTNTSQSNSQSQSQTPSQQGVAGTQLSVLSSQATANSASIVASTININMDTPLPLQPPLASGASSGSGSGSIPANRQLHRSVSAASASSSSSSSSSASSFSSASMREYSPTWCKRALQSYLHTLTTPPTHTNANAAAAATNLQTGISLSHLSIADTIHRHIRYVSMCLFNLPSSSASTNNSVHSVHTQLTANRHFMKALLISV